MGVHSGIAFHVSEAARVFPGSCDVILIGNFFLFIVFLHLPLCNGFSYSISFMYIPLCNMHTWHTPQFLRYISCKLQFSWLNFHTCAHCLRAYRKCTCIGLHRPIREKQGHNEVAYKIDSKMRTLWITTVKRKDTKNTTWDNYGLDL